MAESIEGYACGPHLWSLCGSAPRVVIGIPKEDTSLKCTGSTGCANRVWFKVVSITPDATPAGVNTNVGAGSGTTN